MSRDVIPSEARNLVVSMENEFALGTTRRFAEFTLSEANVLGVADTFILLEVLILS